MMIFEDGIEFNFYPFFSSCFPSAHSNPHFLLPLPPHLLLFLHLLFFLIHRLPPSGQAKLITIAKVITLPGQIGMRPSLHCRAENKFSTCLWFTNSTKIPGGPHSIKDSLGSSTCTDVILLFTMLSQISFPRCSNS